jgi:DNA-binding IclR family transcriptional regulator
MDIKTAARTLDIFETFAAQSRPLRLSELAAVLNAPVSSCFQLVRTLQRRGYVYALHGKTYYPTRRMLQNAQVIDVSDPVLRLAHPVLEALRDKTGESALVAQHAEHNIMILDVVESQHSVRYSTLPGAIRYLHSSSAGKAILGEMTREERDRWLPDPLPVFTSTTIATRAKLDKDLAKSRARGWYESQGETDPDLHSVAIPVHAGGSVLAISVAGPVTRFTKHRTAHVAALKRAVTALATTKDMA